MEKPERKALAGVSDVARQRGERIRQARKARFNTGRELADHLGKPPMTVSRWETGRTVPRTSDLFRLSGALGVTVDWLMYGDDESGAAA